MLKKIIISFFILCLSIYISSFVYAQSQAVSTSSSVDMNSGAFVTSIPIKIPVGIGNAQPNISLSYSSENIGNSSVGVGWNIGGLGYIQRSTKHGVPTYTTSDEFVFSLPMGGGELVKIGTNQYEAKIEGSFLKFIFNGTYWEVWDKNGTEYRLGYLANSRIDNNYGTFQWNLDKVIDTNSNYMTIQYISDSGQKYPSTIYYTGNEATDLPPQFHVNFVYDTSQRPDSFFSYISGALIATKFRLTGVDIYVDSTLQKHYELDYTDWNTAHISINSVRARSFLINVTEFGYDLQTSLPSTKFDYNYMDPDFQGSYNVSAPWNAGIDQNHILIDMTGDSLPDYVIASNSGNWTVYPNTVGNFGPPISWSAPGDMNDTSVSVCNTCLNSQLQAISNTFCGSSAGGINYACCGTFPTQSGYAYCNGASSTIKSQKKLIDFNGDGLPDYVVAWNTGYWDIYLNNGSGFDAMQRIQTPFSYGLDNSHILMDMNGDGLPDYVVANSSGNWTVYYNNGNGFNAAVNINSPGPLDNNHSLVDLNGDGLPDYLYANPSGQWMVSYNNGHGFNAPVALNGLSSMQLDQNHFFADVNGDGLVDFVDAKNYNVYLNSGSAFLPPLRWYSLPTSDFTNAQLIDLNGDGVLDVVSFSNSGNWTVNPGSYSPFLYGPADRMYLIYNHVTGGSFFSSTLTSLLFYQPSIQCPNTKLPFVTHVVTDEYSLDGIQSEYHSSYTYKNGVYDSVEKAFRGFGDVKEIDPEGNITEVWFKQDKVLSGIPYLQKRYDRAGNLYKTSLDTWQIKDLGNGVSFPYRTLNQMFLYDGTSSAIEIDTGLTYDSYGNVTSILNYGRTDVSGDETFTYFDYTYNTSKWILSLPKDTYITDGKGKLASKKWLYYDNLPNGQVSAGNLTEEEFWLDGGTNPQQRYAYDAYGNRIETVDADGDTTEIAYNDPVYKSMPTSITNSLNQTYTLTYDLLAGKARTITDPNGQTITTAYDPLGRVLDVYYPATAPYPTITYTYDFTASPASVLMQELVSLNPMRTIETYTYYDALGRDVEVKTKAENGQQIVSVIKYDSQDNVISRTIPFEVPYSSSYYCVNQIFCPSQPSISYSFDTLNRPIQMVSPNPDGTAKVSTNSYYQLTETFTDPAGKITQKLLDPYNNILQVKEYNNGNIYTTKYAYNTVGKPIQITDNLGNITTLVYDSLGERIYMNNPDQGLSQFVYDPAGRLTARIDANNHIVQNSYDVLGRLTQQDFLTLINQPPGQRKGPGQPNQLPAVPCNPGNPCIQLQQSARYYYDNPLVPNGIGKLTKVMDASGTTEYAYDSMGHISRMIKTVNNIQYEINTIYDVDGTINSLQYPDGETVNYSYNDRGLLEKVVGNVPYINDVEYNAERQLTKIVYGNGVQTDYQNNGNSFNISGIQSYSPSGTSIQNLSYSYDARSLVTGINDGISKSAQQFWYDDLGRLVKASGNYGVKIYQYNSIGNLLVKDGVNYTYSPQQPHAVIAGNNGFTATYDADGNMITENGKSYEYDFEGRLTGIKKSQGSYLAQFVYDYQGSRVLKISPSDTTLYIDKFYEVSPGSITKFIFAGNIRIASEMTKGLGGNPPGVKGGGERGFGCGTTDLTDDNGIVDIVFLFIISAIFMSLLKLKYKYGIESGPDKVRNIFYLALAAWFLVSTFASSINAYGDQSTVNPSHEIYYYLTDRLGSVNAVTDYKGNVVRRIDYTPYGQTYNIQSLSNPAADVDFMFTGQEQDKNTGIYFYNARYYDPVIGRFISPDPKISDPYNPQILNRYSYVGNNPVNYTDLTGEDFFGSIGSAISSAWKSVVSGVTGAAQRLGSWLQKNVWTPLESAINAIGIAISNLPEQVSDMITAAGHALLQLGTTALFNVKQFFSKAYEYVRANETEIIDALALSQTIGLIVLAGFAAYYVSSGWVILTFTMIGFTYGLLVPMSDAFPGQDRMQRIFWGTLIGFVAGVAVLEAGPEEAGIFEVPTSSVLEASAGISTLWLGAFIYQEVLHQKLPREIAALL